MRQMRPLTTEADFASYALIGARAYPGAKVITEADRHKLTQSLITQSASPTLDFYGLFDDQLLLGCMRLHDFRLNMFANEIKAGGVGFVGVDLLHKKEAVAKELISFFLQQCRARDQHLALLYPFRPDFYKRMGFGYGTKISQYRVPPAHLPRGESKAHLRVLGPGDLSAMTDCYNRYYATRHGMIRRAEKDQQSTVSDPEVISIGYQSDAAIEGYMAFSFKPAHADAFFRNDIVVQELVYEHGAALAELLTFLHTQADQIDHIIFNLQDDTFHHLPFDPRNGTGDAVTDLYQETNRQGLGIMYRVVNARALFGTLAEHDFGGQSCTLKITIRDSFLPENAGELIVHFEHGRATVQDSAEYDLAIELDVAEFSALLMGVITFKALYRLNLASLSDPGQLDTINKLFRADEPPICMTHF